MIDREEPQNTTQRDEEADEMIELLNLLDCADRCLTPKHVARRFRELMANLGDDGPSSPPGDGQTWPIQLVTLANAGMPGKPTLSELLVPGVVASRAQIRATELVNGARRVAAEAEAEAESVVADAHQKAGEIIAAATARADAQLQEAADIVAAARGQAADIVAAAREQAAQVTGDTGRPVVTMLSEMMAPDAGQPRDFLVRRISNALWQPSELLPVLAVVFTRPDRDHVDDLHQVFKYSTMDLGFEGESQRRLYRRSQPHGAAVVEHMRCIQYGWTEALPEDFAHSLAVRAASPLVPAGSVRWSLRHAVGRETAECLLALAGEPWRADWGTAIQAVLRAEPEILKRIAEWARRADDRRTAGAVTKVLAAQLSTDSDLHADEQARLLLPASPWKPSHPKVHGQPSSVRIPARTALARDVLTLLNLLVELQHDQAGQRFC